MRGWTVAIGALGLLVGCGEGSDANQQTCTVTNETLNDTQWVMWEALPEGEYRENPMARMKFFQEDNIQKVSYTVKSPGDVYEYSCEEKMGKGNEIKEWFCKEEAHIRDWCQALEVHQAGSCSRRGKTPSSARCALRAIGSPRRSDRSGQ